MVETTRKISQRLRTTYATSARLISQVLLPGAHNLGTHSACHSYHLPAPTRRRSRSADSYVQREQRQPQLREICHLPKNASCPYKTSPQLGSGRNIFEVSHSQRRNRKTALPTAAQKQLLQFTSKTSREAHREVRGQAPSRDLRSRKQATKHYQEEFTPQHASRCVQTGFLQRGKRISVCPASSVALVALVHGSYHT